MFPGSPRPAADAASGGSAGGSARAGAGAGLRGLDRSRHVAPEQAVVAAMRGGGTGPVLDAGERYKKIVADTARLDALLVDLFLD